MKQCGASWLTLCALGLGVLHGCGSSEDESGGEGQGGNGPTASGGAAQTGGSVATGGSSGDTGGATAAGGLTASGGSAGMAECSQLEGLDDCGWQSERANFRPVQLLLVIDKSYSMAQRPDGAAEAKWDSMVRAVRTALEPLRPMIRVGLLLYPDQALQGDLPADQACTMAPSDGSVDVPVDVGDTSLPEINALLAATSPGGGTPMAEALRRAHAHFANQPQGDPGEHYVLLATDGGPNCNPNITCDASGCVPNLEGTNPLCNENNNCCEDDPRGCVDSAAVLEQIAALQEISVQTIVVGIPGSEPFADYLDSFAVAGGQPNPDPEADRDYYAVSAGAGGEGLQQIITQITVDLIHDCEIVLEEAPASPNQVNVAVDCTVVTQDLADDNSGWHYDDDANPSRIILDGDICTQIMTEGAVRVDVVYGCPTLG